jgi:hypothetical protein
MRSVRENDGGRNARIVWVVGSIPGVNFDFFAISPLGAGVVGVLRLWRLAMFIGSRERPAMLRAFCFTLVMGTPGGVR